MMNDSTLNFGVADLSGAVTEFPDVLDLGNTSVNRMTVDVYCGNAAGGTSLTVKVQGGNTASGPWTDVGVNTIVLEDLKAGTGSAAVSPNKFRFLKTAFVKTGTFTAGTCTAQLNTYAGK